MIFKGKNNISFLVYLLQGIQSNFEKYAKQMEERYADQQRRLEDEISKRKEAVSVMNHCLTLFRL